MSFAILDNPFWIGFFHKLLIFKIINPAFFSRAGLPNTYTDIVGLGWVFTRNER